VVVSRTVGKTVITAVPPTAVMITDGGVRGEAQRDEWSAAHVIRHDVHARKDAGGD
jgi:hypothetical protein